MNAGIILEGYVIGYRDPLLHLPHAPVSMGVPRTRHRAYEAAAIHCFQLVRESRLTWGSDYNLPQQLDDSKKKAPPIKLETSFWVSWRNSEGRAPMAWRACCFISGVSRSEHASVPFLPCFHSVRDKNSLYSVHFPFIPFGQKIPLFHTSFRRITTNMAVDIQKNVRP